MSRVRSAAEQQFRAELTCLLDSPELAAALAAIRQGVRDPRPVYRLLGQHTMLAPSWPAELGGRGAPAWAAGVVAEELVARGVPDMMHVLSVQSVGTALLPLAGTGSLRTVLRSIAAGTTFAAVLF